MKRMPLYIVTLLASMVLVACKEPPKENTPAQPDQQVQDTHQPDSQGQGDQALDTTSQSEAPVGADQDAHGCKGSAGYQWCAKTEQCERPWELSEKEGIENTEEAFAKYCGH